ncbi:hypothetical protein ACTMU2_41710 [Cupriavidus basilensis]
MDVLCTDKTGTLTQDRVILKHHLDLSGKESEQVLEFAYLNSFFQSGLRNLLDVAVLQHEDVGQRIGIHEQWRLIDEIPFDFTRRRMVRSWWRAAKPAMKASADLQGRGGGGI